MSVQKRVAPPAHPGEVLREEFMIPQGMTSEELSMHSTIPLKLVKDLVCERDPCSAYLAGRLAATFGTTRDYWLEMQKRYDAYLMTLVQQAPLSRSWESSGFGEQHG